MRDGVTEDGIVGCTVTVDGFGDTLTNIDLGSGRYDVDYLPPDAYTVLISCDGYQDATLDHDVSKSTARDGWDTPAPIAMTQI